MLCILSLSIKLSIDLSIYGLSPEVISFKGKIDMWRWRLLNWDLNPKGSLHNSETFELWTVTTHQAKFTSFFLRKTMLFFSW